MRSFSFILVSSLVAAALAACGGSQSLGGSAGSGAMMPGVPAGRHSACMAADAKKKGALMYAGDWATNDVFVYDYPSGKQVGTLTGFDAPYGMCVDKKGDIYIRTFTTRPRSSTRMAGRARWKPITPSASPWAARSTQRAILP